MGNIVGNSKNREGTGNSGNNGEESIPTAAQDLNQPTTMTNRRPSQEREQNKLRCTLKNASKQGDRPINPPKRYTAEIYENTRKGNGQHTREKETRTATVGGGRDRSSVNEVDIPTSPMLMRESEQSGVETSRDVSETLPSPHNRGNGVNVLIRTQNTESSDVHGRRASAGLDDNGNVGAFVLPTPTEAAQNPFHLVNDQMRATLWGQYRQMANNLGTSPLDNAALMNAYNQQAMNAMITGGMAPPNMPPMPPIGPQFPLMHWNPLTPYNNVAPPNANANATVDCPACTRRAVQEFSEHFVNAFLVGVANKFRNYASHHTCNHHIANGAGSSHSNSSATIPALSNPNNEHSEMSTPVVPTNLPRPQPTFVVFSCAAQGWTLDRSETKDQDGRQFHGNCGELELKPQFYCARSDNQIR
ncbi:hypothetical protein Aduo_000791 [Ancylostoma duodenale]